MSFDNPLTSFTILLLVSLVVPPLFERMRLPGLIGLLVAGVALGHDGLQLLSSDSETMKLLSDIGKVYLMFVAGLEIDLVEFRKKQNRSLTFGILTFSIPLIFGIVLGRGFGMGWNTSVLIGSLLASHTLLAYPIILRLGLARKEAVAVTVGATIITDIGALLVLAICVSAKSGNLSAASLAGQVISLALYAAFLLFGLEWLGKEYFRRTGNEESNQFLFVLLALFLASAGAELINTDKIVGAFLAGLAVNDVVGHSPVEEKVEFIGSALFIPFFFVDMGLLLDVEGFRTAITTDLNITIAIVGCLFLSKFLAAWGSKLIFRYSWDEMMTMWSLSLPQVAATLAAALVAYQVDIINASVFNAVIVLMVTTSIAGPILTARYAGRIPPDSIAELSEFMVELENSNGSEEALLCNLDDRPGTAVIALRSPASIENLIFLGMALIERGALIPLAVTVARTPTETQPLRRQLHAGQQLVQRAENAAYSLIQANFAANLADTPPAGTASTSSPLSSPATLSVRSIVRLDDDAALGITRVAHEQAADWIIMGWHETASVSARLMGNTVDAVLWSAPCPVIIAAIQADLRKFRRIMVAIENFSANAIRLVQVGQAIAKFSQADLSIVYIGAHAPDPEVRQGFELTLNELELTVPLQIIITDRTAEAILDYSEQYDLTVIHCRRFRTAGGFSVHDTYVEVTSRIMGSVIAVSEPTIGDYSNDSQYNI